MRGSAGSKLRHACAVLLVTSVWAAAFAGCIGSADPTTDGLGATGPDADEPVVERESFEGRIVCGFAMSGSRSNPCALAPGSRNFFEAAAPRDTRTLLVGLTWSPTHPSNEKLSMNVESGDYSPLEGSGVRFASASGNPDIVIRLESEQLEQMSGLDLNRTSIGLQLRVFPGGTGATVDQPFELHVASYIGARAPEDATPFPTD